tara:strand:- start:1148 stop:1387 length:240 start_codon:yes stop_codon:yes gene_type:complete
MNYDNWKLASPDYDDSVSRCCGADYSDAVEKEDEDFGYHEYQCSECDEYCEIQDEREYHQERHESYLEDCADDERMLGI